MDLKIQCHELGIGLFVKIQLGIAIAPRLVLLLYKTEQYQVVGFIKPTIVGSKNSTSPALRVGWYALLIRVNYVLTEKGKEF